MASFSKTVWSNSGDNRHVQLVSDFKGNGNMYKCACVDVCAYVCLSMKDISYSVPPRLLTKNKW